MKITPIAIIDSEVHGCGYWWNTDDTGVSIYVCIAVVVYTIKIQRDKYIIA